MKISRLLRRLIPAVLVLVCLVATTPACAAPATQVTDAEVQEAIKKIQDYFYQTQDATGAWFGKYHGGPGDGQDKNAWGPTAMALLALISSGESPQHPQIAKGLKVLAEAEFKGVYAFSMRCHVWSYLPQGIYGKLMAKDAERMLNSSYGPSRFGYELVDEGSSRNEGKGGRIDNSTTQYGVLALWQASKTGLNVPDGFWADTVDNFLGQQSDVDGGWAYSGNRNTSETMTCAGLTCLYVAQQELFRDKSTPNQKVADSISKGLACLDGRFGKQHEAHGGAGYLYYGYERVALASGRKYFGGQDWFQTFAKKIIAKNGNYGGSHHEAAFHLMFLARGGVPVWINKFEIPGYAWNNRPNDIYFLNKYISGYREHEVNWQALNIDTSGPAEWISCPISWISGAKALELDEKQTEKIKQYLDLGGTLIFNPEEKSSSFRASVKDLAEKMYPDLKFEQLDREHPMANLLEGDPRGSRKPDIEVLSNGARVLMILPKDDWGMTFQADEKPDPSTNDHWKYITNIYGVATDRGELTPRLSSPMVAKTNRAKTGTIKVVVPVWQDPAGKLQEANIYSVMENYMFNQTGVELDVQAVPLAELASHDPALLHMVGVNEIEIKPDERKAIEDYIKSGGTILIETLGGSGKFSSSVSTQLAGVLPGVEDSISTRSDIITGRNLPEGSQNNRRLIYRRLVLERANPDARLLLRGHAVTKGEDDRYPVLLSYEDISLGMLGVRQFGINGYAPETARNLMVNILLEAHKAKTGG